MTGRRTLAIWQRPITLPVVIGVENDERVLDQQYGCQSPDDERYYAHNVIRGWIGSEC